MWNYNDERQISASPFVLLRLARNDRAAWCKADFSKSRRELLDARWWRWETLGPSTTPHFASLVAAAQDDNSVRATATGGIDKWLGILYIQFVLKVTIWRN